MTYAQLGLIQASDYNNFVGNAVDTGSNRLNTVWSTGGASAGYGQTPAVGTVNIGQVVSATEWDNLISKTSTVAIHQGTSISSVALPVVGGAITYTSAIPANLTSIYNNRLNAATQGTTVSNTATRGSSWSNSITFTHTVTFANGNAARYFFNSGGQLAITCTHPTGIGINILYNGLASNIGTVVLSAPTSGTVTIAGQTYNGITKKGGGGSAPTISTNNGYYALTTSNANVFTQTASSGYISYSNSFIRIIAKSNGTQGSNGDAGSIITLYTVWDEVPDGAVATSGSATTLTVRPPETTNIANTWGTISISGSVAGS